MIRSAAALVGTKQITAQQAFEEFWGPGVVYVMQNQKGQRRVVYSAGDLSRFGYRAGTSYDVNWDIIEVVTPDSEPEKLAIRGKGWSWCFK